MTRFFPVLAAIAALGFATPVAAQMADTPVTNDSRIRTLVYNENDVFKLLTHFGYQLNVEFGQKEKIETISVGDRTGWQIIPTGRRLFIRAMEDRAHTNMTVVTNRRAYQFDLQSVPQNTNEDELVYVVRFFYPEDEMRSSPMSALSPVSTAPSYPTAPAYPTAPSYPTAPVASDLPPMNPAPTAYTPEPLPPIDPAPMPETMAAPMATPMPTEPVSVDVPAVPVATVPMAGQNFQYTFTGSEALVPKEIFDDGATTYMQLAPGRTPPELYQVTAKGTEQRVPLVQGNQYLTAQGVYSRLVVRQNGQHACIYNEATGR